MASNSDNKEVSTKNSETEVVLSILSKEEVIAAFQKLGKFLKEKYNISPEEALVMQQGGYLVPITVFSTELSPSEAITKYLKEKYDLQFSEIAHQLHKDTSSIWASYQRSQEKVQKNFKFQDSDIMIPASAFSHDMSVLECLMVYLKDVRNMKVAKLSGLLKKNKSTLWTAYNRGKAKSNGK